MYPCCDRNSVWIGACSMWSCRGVNRHVIHCSDCCIKSSTIKFMCQVIKSSCPWKIFELKRRGTKYGQLSYWPDLSDKQFHQTSNAENQSNSLRDVHSGPWASLYGANKETTTTIKSIGWDVNTMPADGYPGSYRHQRTNSHGNGCVWQATCIIFQG